MTPNALELSILRELRKPSHPTPWLTCAEIATALDEPPWRVRAHMTELRHRNLVERGATLERAGYFTLTGAGLFELTKTDQLRLV